MIDNYRAGFELFGTIAAALGFQELCHGLDSRTVSIGTIVLFVTGLLLMLLV